MNFARTLFTVSGLTMLSRLAGFVRDTLTALLLGTGLEADAFFVAQRLPNLFRSLFAEGAFAAAFVPLYSKEAQTKSRDAAQKFAGEALALLLAVLIPFTLLMIAFMPYVISVIAPGFGDEPEKYQAAIHYSRVTFPYLLLISVTALQGGILNAQGRFAPAAAAPIAFNLVLIGALFVAQIMKLPVGETQSWAITVSGIVQATWLAYSCRRAGVSIPILRPRLNDSTRRLFKQVGLGAIGAGATQINLLVSTGLASMLPTGAVSYLYYADRLNQLPLGIVGIAVATTLLPVLSRHVQSGDADKVRHYMSRSIEFCLALGLPATVGLGVAALPIIQTLFEHGAFTHAAAMETSRALMAYSLGIPAFLLVKVFSARFFARHDTKTPVKIAIIAMITNVVGALSMLHYLGHTGIALAASLASWVNAGLLFATLLREGEKMGDTSLFYRLPRLLFCAAGMGLVTLAAMEALRPWFESKGNLPHEMIGLALIIGPSTAAYALLLQFTGAMRWKEALAMLKRKELK